MKPWWLILLAACGKPPCAHETTPRGVITTCHDGQKREVAGVVVEDVHYVDGVRDGLYVSRYANGVEHERGSYRRGQRVGAWVSSHENGKPWITATYVDGVPHGVWTELDFAGNKMFVGTYDHGKLEGDWETKRDDGTPRAKGTSHAGKLDGRVTQFSEDGGRMELGYRANRLHGTTTVYDAAGKVVQTVEFADGVEVTK